MSITVLESSCGGVHHGTEAVLAAVGLVSYHYNILAVGEFWKMGFTFSWHELLNGGEDYAT